MSFGAGNCVSNSSFTWRKIELKQFRKDKGWKCFMHIGLRHKVDRKPREVGEMHQIHSRVLQRPLRAQQAVGRYSAIRYTARFESSRYLWHHRSKKVYRSAVGLVLSQRLARWPNNKTTLDQHLVFSGTEAPYTTEYLQVDGGNAFLWNLNIESGPANTSHRPNELIKESFVLQIPN